MSSLASILSDRLADLAGIDPELRVATKPQFGHFQSNVALRLARQMGAQPRQVANDLVAKLDVNDLCEPLEIAGPGFINFRLKPQVLADQASALVCDTDGGVTPVDEPQTIVIDYSSPNVAKQMHVGHLRSTIIGDCFTRVLRALGHTVIPQNHIGDWGRQFGMLIEQILDEGLDLDSLDLAGAEELYLRANVHLKEDEGFADRARDRVVKLQAGDQETRRMWQRLIDISTAGFNATYQRMNILLTDDDLAGESIYNAELPKICDDLEQRGIARMDDGALAVFVDGMDVPAILRNKNGGYGYDVTDIAAIHHRVDTLHADRIIYVVGSPQAFHFQLVFAVCRQAGYLPETVVAEHVGFGQVLGPDGKKFSTREGTAVHLDDLLDQAEELAAPNVALAAIKYADLSNGLQKDYVFDPARMTATTGDTGPYLQYAHARICQILRKAEAEIGDKLTQITAVKSVDEPAEQQLALVLGRFAETITEVGQTLAPHKLCAYLYELAQAFSVFYEKCPVLKSTGDVLESRLALCMATKNVLARGLYLLGIDAPERM